MSEQGQQPPEQDPFKAFHEQWEAHMYTNREEELGDMACVEDRAAMFLNSDNSRQALRYTADIIRWAVWGKYQEDSPPGLAIEVTDRTRLGYDHVLMSENVFLKMRGLLDSCGMSGLRETVIARRKEKVAALVPSLAAIMNEHVAARNLRMAASPVPREAAERPLTEAEKVIAESTLQGQIMQECRSTDPAVVKRTGIGHSRFKRGLFEIDTRVVQDNNTFDENRQRWLQAQRFVTSHAAKGTAAGIEAHDVGCFDETVDLTLEMAGRHMEKELLGPSDLDFTTNNFWNPYYMMGHLLDSSCDGDFGQSWQSALEFTARTELCDEEQLLWYKDNSIANVNSSLLEPQVWVRCPQRETRAEPPPGYSLYQVEREVAGQYLTHREVDWHVLDVDKARVIGAVRQAQASCLGRILQFEIADSFNGPNNLIGAVSERNALVLAGLQCERAQRPSVPGLALLEEHKYKGNYGFIEQKSDPYVACRITVPSHRIPSLLEDYRAIGLRGLANDLQNVQNVSGQITVDDLVTYLRKHARYTTPKGEDEIHYPYKIADCAQFVREEKLHAQCSGSYIFLAYSLRHLYGESCSIAPVVGHVIESSVITNLPHIQLGFIYDERYYILDSTAPRGAHGASVLYRMSETPTTGAVDPAQKFAPFVKHFSRDNAAVHEARPIRQAAPDPIQLHKNLQNALIQAFGIPSGSTEALEKAIVSRADFDPIRRTYQVSHWAAKYGLAPEVRTKIAETRAFITSVQKAHHRGNREALLPLAYYLKTEALPILNSLAAHLKDYDSDPAGEEQ